MKTQLTYSYGLNKPTYYSVFFLILMLFSACVSPSKAARSSISYNSDRKFNRSEFMYLLTKEEVAPLKHAVIGYVGTVGNEHMTSKEVLNEFLHEAWKAGANAVAISSIKDVTRTSSRYVSNQCCCQCCQNQRNNSCRCSRRNLELESYNYSASKIGGIAYWIQVTPEFKEENGEGIPMDFISQSKKRQDKESDGAMVSGFLLVLGAVLAIIIDQTSE